MAHRGYCWVPKLCLIFWEPTDCSMPASLSFTISWSLLKCMSIESVMPSNILSSVAPFSSCLQSFPSIRVFSSGSALCIRWSKYWPSASASVLPMNIRGWFPLGWTGLISICPRDFQESSPAPQFKASIRWHSDFFVVQLSHPYMTTGKTIAFTRWTFVSKKMPLLFNMFSRIVMAFFPRSKYLNFRAAVSIHSDSGA